MKDFDSYYSTFELNSLDSCLESLSTPSKSCLKETSPQTCQQLIWNQRLSPPKMLGKQDKRNAFGSQVCMQLKYFKYLEEKGWCFETRIS